MNTISYTNDHCVHIQCLIVPACTHSPTPVRSLRTHTHTYLAPTVPPACVFDMLLFGELLQAGVALLCVGAVHLLLRLVGANLSIIHTHTHKCTHTHQYNLFSLV